MNIFETLWLLLWCLYALESFDYARADEAVIARGLGGYQAGLIRLNFKFPLPGSLHFAFDSESNHWNRVALRQRLATLQRLLRWQRWLSWMSFVGIFVVMPLLYLRMAERVHFFLWGLGCTIGLWWGSAVAIFVADRKLNPGPLGPALQKLLHALLAPGFALRGSEALSRGALKSWHPIAAASLLLSKPDFEALLLKVYLDELYRVQAPPRLNEAWLLRGAQPEALRVWAKQEGYDLEALAGSPVQQTESHSYCPRCRSQFTLKAGLCPDCELNLKSI